MKVTITGTSIFKTKEEVLSTVKDMKRKFSGVTTIEMDSDTYQSLLDVEKRELDKYNKSIDMEQRMKETKLPIKEDEKKRKIEEFKKNPKSFYKTYIWNRSDFGEIEIEDVELVNLYGNSGSYGKNKSRKE